MSSIIRLLDMKDRIDQTCYFCGTKKSVKYLVTDAIGDSGQLIGEEIACCNKCLLQHVYANEQNLKLS